MKVCIWNSLQEHLGVTQLKIPKYYRLRRYVVLVSHDLQPLLVLRHHAYNMYGSLAGN